MIDRWLERLALLGGVLLVTVSGLIGYEVVARYLFNAPTTWILDVSIYLTMGATFLAAGHTLRAGAHIRMDLKLPQTLISALAASGIGPLTFILAVSMIFLFLGDFLEVVSITLITLPSSIRFSRPCRSTRSGSR
ncbi:MAG: TRAP transporter small permease subunit [Candidatus Rokubacteria bacterium]|nr:TRAP transporter small permease subunit [Candidatus Rokubacteria bacterium]